MKMIKGYSEPRTNVNLFTKKEVERLWEEKDGEWVDSVLLLLYSGLRIPELTELKREDVDLEARTMKGGAKTQKRTVPIHSKVFDIVQRHYNEGNEYLFTYNGSKVSKNQYCEFWNAITERLRIKHDPQAMRHSFINQLTISGAKKQCIDLLIGYGTQESTYKTMEDLRAAIEMIQ